MKTTTTKTHLQLHAISSHSSQPKDRALILGFVLPVFVGWHSLQAHWDKILAHSGRNLGLAAVLGVVAEERSLVGGWAAAYQSIAVEVDPRPGVVDVVLVERRIADEREARRDCTGCGLPGCSLKRMAKAVVGASIAAGNSLVVAGVGCNRLKVGCRIAVVTCIADSGP